MIRRIIATSLGCLVLAGYYVQAVAQQESKDSRQPPISVADDVPDGSTERHSRNSDDARWSADSTEKKPRDLSGHAALGVTLTDNPHGPWIVAVHPNSPASQVGLRAGDQIVGINEQSCYTVRDVMRLIREHHPGDDVEVEISRDGNLQRHEVTLAASAFVFGLAMDGPPRRYRALRPGLDPLASIDEMKLRIKDLEAEVESLRQQLNELRAQLRMGNDDVHKAPLGAGAIDLNEVP